MTTCGDGRRFSKEHRDAAWWALVRDDVYRGRITLSEFEAFAIARFANVSEKRERMLINMSWVCDEIGQLPRHARTLVLANSSVRRELPAKVVDLAAFRLARTHCRGICNDTTPGGPVVCRRSYEFWPPSARVWRQWGDPGQQRYCRTCKDTTTRYPERGCRECDWVDRL